MLDPTGYIFGMGFVDDLRRNNNDSLVDPLERYNVIITIPVDFPRCTVIMTGLQKCIILFIHVVNFPRINSYALCKHWSNK